MTNGKTAILLGASGMVGAILLDMLLKSIHYDKVIAFVRKQLPVSHPKLTTHIIDFDQPESYRDLVQGDDLFCCLGTTIKQAETQEAFRKVDYGYPVQFADIAQKNGVKHYLLISSIGADSDSSIFYLRTKGECEDAIRQKSIVSVSVFRPASLSGTRKEVRVGEKICLAFLKTFSFLLIGKLAKYKPIEAKQVACAMLSKAQEGKAGFSAYESDEIQAIRQAQ